MRHWMMRLGCWLAVSLGLALAPALGREAPAVVSAANPTLWTIQKPNGKTIVLLGTVHILPPSVVWRTEAVNGALNGADVVVLEASTEPEALAGIQQSLQDIMLNPPGVTLSTLLKADEIATVEQAALAVGAPFTQLEPLRPWMAALQLAAAYALQAGFDPASGVDRHVGAEAKALGKTLEYFETPMEQIEIFSTLPQDQEIAFLVLGAKDIVADPHALIELVNAWATGDQAALDALMNGAFEQMPALAERVLSDRNKSWVTRISAEFMTDDRNYLIAVGAGHLTGRDSVPALLRAQGITVDGP